MHIDADTRDRPERASDPSDRVTHVVDLLAARCLASLRAMEAGGGPDVATHLGVIRRALSRPGPRGHRNRDRVRRTVATVADGGLDATARAELRAHDHRALLQDLRQLDRVLSRSARIGTSSSGTSRVDTSSSGPSPLRSCHRADG